MVVAPEPSCTRKFCVNARGIPPAVYQVLAVVLSGGGGYPIPGQGVPHPGWEYQWGVCPTPGWGNTRVWTDKQTETITFLRMRAIINIGERNVRSVYENVLVHT